MLNHQPPSREEARDLCDYAVKVVGHEQALAILGVHRTTLLRWRKGEVRIPHAALALLRIWREGRLPGMGDDWRGFSFFGDRLYTPAGIGYSAREIEGWHWQQQHCESTNRRNAQLEALVRDLSDKLQAIGGAANDRTTGRPDAPPPRPKRVSLG
ncbi:MAG TPA: DUF3653 domain-containing protein [Paraburkholderia sp.]|uniref:DUF3653 domain-containing protein n=1 Tax=Paraburkholderia sp. TaxID=1926495 RepID=UPI002BA516AC|nr:DUF3653 domain-containing protein [Paraburkholderia sp.]HTR11568.1 DUF3653 domain-containing protein [Paraburkholderia sp.]